MSKPPLKGAAPTQAQTRTVSAKVHQTRSTTTASTGNNPSSQNSPKTPNGHAQTTLTSANTTESNQLSTGSTPTESPLKVIIGLLKQFVNIYKLDNAGRHRLEEIIVFAQTEAGKECSSRHTGAEQLSVSSIRKAVFADLVEMHNSLASRINGVQETANATLTAAERVAKEAEVSKDAVKDLADNLGKVTEATNKLAKDTSPYRTALLSNGRQANAVNADPRVLYDLDRRDKQILIDIFDKEGTNTLANSLAELVGKANEALGKIEDANKPKDIKVLAASKGRRQTVLLTLNSKEAVQWIRETDIEMAFTSAFSEGSHIRARAYNIIVPRVPITFDPKSEAHLREVEEANGLNRLTIASAKWIKPIGRRRLDQTHAYAILSIACIASVNTLIRDGLNICGTKVRPSKQKHEPIQCMKCRRWGHFATECLADKDTCGTCGEEHRTIACKGRDKLFCVSCGDNSHASWDRHCPEFLRRCAIMDERNPQNAMPFYPSDQDWTLVTRPDRIPLDLRFPGKYAVNSLPITNRGQALQRPHTGSQRQGSQHATVRRRVAGNARENPNCIPLNRVREEGEVEDDYWKHGLGELMDEQIDSDGNPYHDCPEWE
jgi:hypothetical protein